MINADRERVFFRLSLLPRFDGEKAVRELRRLKIRVWRSASQIDGRRSRSLFCTTDRSIFARVFGIRLKYGRDWSWVIRKGSKEYPTFRLKADKTPRVPRSLSKKIRWSHIVPAPYSKHAPRTV